MTLLPQVDFKLDGRRQPRRGTSRRWEVMPLDSCKLNVLCKGAPGKVAHAPIEARKMLSKSIASEALGDWWIPSSVTSLRIEDVDWGLRITCMLEEKPRTFAA